MQSKEPRIILESVSKSFGSFPALKQLNLKVYPGEVFALLGPNGAGKTTTMQLLTGMLSPSEGRAEVCGYDCFRQRVNAMAFVGYQPDEPMFQDHVSGWDYIRFAGDLRGMSATESQSLGKALADVLQLTDDLYEYAVNYSKGMRKKLAAVLALMHEPEVLILDEPTNGLDPYATRDFHQLIRERVQKGTAIIFSTHLLDQAQKLCDRVGIIHKGELMKIGSMDELTEESGQDLEQIFFDSTGDSPSVTDPRVQR